MFATPGRTAKFSDFCDSAFKKGQDETNMKIEGLESPCLPAVKKLFGDGDVSSSELESSLIDFDNDESVKKMEKMIDACNQSYSLAPLFGDKKEKNTVMET